MIIHNSPVNSKTVENGFCPEKPDFVCTLIKIVSGGLTRAIVANTTNNRWIVPTVENLVFLDRIDFRPFSTKLVFGVHYMPKYYEISTSTAVPDNNDIGFVIADTGAIIKTTVDTTLWLSGRMPVLFDVVEYLTRNPVLEDIIDILEIGYWTGDGHYEPFDPKFIEFRKDSQDWCNAQTN